MTDSYDIELLIADFFRAFDAHDWVGMRLTLADELKIDYSTPRGGTPKPLSVNPDSFVRQRRNSMDSLDMTHGFQMKSLSVDESTARATCDYALERTSHGGERQNNSWGEYEFSFVRDLRRGWRISSIAQLRRRSEGAVKLHAA